MNRNLRIAARTLGVATALALGAACGSGDDADTFVGRADALDANLALVVDGDQVAAYLCDDGHIAEWFRGQLADGRAELVSADGDTRLHATVEDGHASAEVQRDGQTVTVDAAAATGDAGLYRAEAGTGDERVVAAWVRLNDGPDTGAQTKFIELEGDLVVQAAPRLNDATGTVKFATGLSAPIQRVDTPGFIESGVDI